MKNNTTPQSNKKYKICSIIRNTDNKTNRNTITKYESVSKVSYLQSIDLRIKTQQYS